MLRLTSKLRIFVVLTMFTVGFPIASAVHVPPVAQAALAPVTVPLISAGTTTPIAGQTGPDGVQDTEIDQTLDGPDLDTADGGEGTINRTIVTAPASGVSAQSGQKAKSNPQQVQSFDGLNFHDQRFANSGNQFSVEPPDQGLCAGNGFVMESVNDVLRIYSTGGTAKTGVVDLNTFYKYAPAINRATSPLTFGPEVTDPSCYYDPDTQRWFQVALTLDRLSSTTQSLAGTNHLDIAVSQTADPTGSWTIYRLPVQNDGTQGTPNHGCVRTTATGRVPGPCLGDYPHIGADANGFYITTNEFNLFAPGFRGAQIYAISKQALVNGTVSGVVLYDTAADASLQINGDPGFTVWPATSPAGNYNPDNGGTEYFLSSTAVFTGFSTQLEVWTLTNSQSLDTSSPTLTLAVSTVKTTGYGIPPASTQKAGSIPLRDCLADKTLQVTATLTGCWRLLTTGGPWTNVESRLASNDSRMQQVIYANGKLWGALDTGLTFDGVNVYAGIAYFVLHPTSTGGGTISSQGYLGINGDNVTYPAVAVTPSGRGVIGFTVTGADYYPSAGWASLDALVGVGPYHIAQAGAGPQDGFSGYVPLSQNSATRIRPRWGDYGAAVADGSNIWIASEYIGQTCTFAQYTATPFGTCGGTRAALGNWDTRITQLTP